MKWNKFINFVKRKTTTSGGGKRVKRTIKYKKLHNVTKKTLVRNGKKKTKVKNARVSRKRRG